MPVQQYEADFYQRFYWIHPFIFRFSVVCNRKITDFLRANGFTKTQEGTLTCTASRSILLCFSANSGRADCMKPNLPHLASAAVRLRGRKNVAVVDVTANPVTAKRFGIDENVCVKILL